MRTRSSSITRTTSETDIEIKLDLDGTGVRTIKTQIGFLDHMFDLFYKHGLFDGAINVVRSDLQIDEHHTAEDVGIALGQAFDQALGDRKGIKRYGFFILPMDEALVEVAVDLGGRAWFELKDSQGYEYTFDREKVGDLSTELIFDILEALSTNMRANLHITVRSGRNAHHIIEGIFKCLARALRVACEIDPRAADQVPSTKGKL